MPIEPFRLTSRHLSYQGDFQREHQARVDRPLESLDLVELFQNVQANLAIGDKVEVVAYSDNSFQDVREIGTARIVARIKSEHGPARIRAVWVGNIFKVPQDPEAQAVPQKPRKFFVKETFGGGFAVEDDRGNTLHRGTTKIECEEYVANIEGQAPKKRGRPPKEEAKEEAAA